MNSANIAIELEKLHPSPSLHLDANLHTQCIEAVENLAGVIWWDCLALLPKNVLLPRSAEYFSRTRAERFGGPLDEVAVAMGGAEAWKKAAAPGGAAEKLVRVLRESKRDEGPFVLGSEVSYGDFTIVSVFECVERTSKEDYGKLMALDPSFGKLHEACRVWLERDD